MSFSDLKSEDKGIWKEGLLRDVGERRLPM